MRDGSGRLIKRLAGLPGLGRHTENDIEDCEVVSFDETINTINKFNYLQYRKLTRRFA